MECKKCGNKYNKDDKFCSSCGIELKGKKEETIEVKEKTTFWWGVLGFFIPIVGLILFIVWNKTEPRKSKSSGIGALVGFLLKLIVIPLILIIAFFALFASTEDDGKAFKGFFSETVRDTADSYCDAKGNYDAVLGKREESCFGTNIFYNDEEYYCCIDRYED